MADRDLQAYYARDEERDRLTTGVGLVEYLRSVEVIGRTLPPAPAVIGDIGGGPGRYTEWLVDEGHRVVHRDLVSHHVDQVRSRHPEDVDADVGDARALDLDDGSLDGLLLLGPLYHLEESEDRLTALREARRVTRPGGPVYVAGISRWAARLHGMLVERVHTRYPAIADMVDEMERTGEMRPIHETSFNGYAHTPQQLHDELVAAGFVVESMVSLEGISFALADLDERLDDVDERAFLLDMLRATESNPDLLGVGPHLLATARADDS